MGERCLEVVELGLARGQVGLTLVELCGTGGDVLHDAALVGQLALEPLGAVAQPLLLEQKLGLTLADRLVPRGDAGDLLLGVRLARRQPALAVGDLLVARA